MHVPHCARHVHLAWLLRFPATRWIHLSLATGAGAPAEIHDSLPDTSDGLHVQSRRSLFAHARCHLHLVSQTKESEG